MFCEKAHLKPYTPGKYLRYLSYICFASVLPMSPDPNILLNIPLSVFLSQSKSNVYMKEFLLTSWPDDGVNGVYFHRLRLHFSACKTMFVYDVMSVYFLWKCQMIRWLTDTLKYSYSHGAKPVVYVMQCGHPVMQFFGQ